MRTANTLAATCLLAFASCATEPPVEEITYTDGKADGAPIPITLTPQMPEVERLFACFGVSQTTCGMTFTYDVHDLPALQTRLAAQGLLDGESVVIATIVATGDDAESTSRTFPLTLRWSPESGTLEDPARWPYGKGLPPGFYTLSIRKAEHIDNLSFDLGLYWPG